MNPIFVKVAAIARALLSWAPKNALAPTAEDAMSSTLRIHPYKSLTHYLSRFRYVDFVIKSTPLMCVAFIFYVILHGTFW
jgi:hypothetical protein